MGSSLFKSHSYERYRPIGRQRINLLGLVLVTQTDRFLKKTCCLSLRGVSLANDEAISFFEMEIATQPQSGCVAMTTCRHIGQFELVIAQSGGVVVEVACGCGGIAQAFPGLGHAVFAVRKSCCTHLRNRSG